MNFRFPEITIKIADEVPVLKHNLLQVGSMISFVIPSLELCNDLKQNYLYINSSL